VHGFTGTQVDENSFIFNGDATGGGSQDGTRIHMIRGGSVKNNSNLWNGDMDPASFTKNFCEDREDKMRWEKLESSLLTRRPYLAMSHYCRFPSFVLQYTCREPWLLPGNF
jgi:hypothetical protein